MFLQRPKAYVTSRDLSTRKPEWEGQGRIQNPLIGNGIRVRGRLHCQDFLYGGPKFNQDLGICT